MAPFKNDKYRAQMGLSRPRVWRMASFSASDDNSEMRSEMGSPVKLMIKKMTAETNHRTTTVWAARRMTKRNTSLMLTSSFVHNRICADSRPLARLVGSFPFVRGEKLMSRIRPVDG